MKITLNEIPDDGSLRVELKESGEDLNRFLGESSSHILKFKEPAGGIFDISKKERTLFINVRIEGSVQVVCSRCLADFDYPINGTSKLVLYPECADVESVDPDDDRDYYDGEKIDIKEILDEETLMLVPFNPLCRDDCKGLCSVCGANLNEGACGCSRKDVDERFSVLKGLKI
ncbi:MAG: DUF177 domain-containing protein [Deltaproteobacteria bacterium]|nr:DUF177 domain-containing protein [Deltaproteobacteria bacterium]